MVRNSALLAAAAIVAAATPAIAADGFLGVYLTEDRASSDGALIEEVAPDSPAADAGLRKGDHVVRCNGRKIANSAALIPILVQGSPGDVLELRVERDGWQKSLKVTLARRSGAPADEPGPARPPKPRDQRGFLGVFLREGPDGEAVIDGVQAGSAAASAGLRSGDVVGSVAGRPVNDPQALVAALGGYGPGEEVVLGVRRGTRTMDVRVVLGRRSAGRRAPAPTGPPADEPEAPSPSDRKPAYLGVALLDDDGAGPLRVDDVQANSPAERFGLRDEDVIVAVGDADVQSIEEFVKAFEGLYAGDIVVLHIERDGWRSEVRVTLGERPKD